ncbi:MAG: alpha/beta fold hydrolase [Chloroflexota bacterium]
MPAEGFLSDAERSTGETLPAGVISEFVARPEGRLRVLRAGDQGSPVLLLSGAGLDSALLSWRHAIPALAQHEHRVFALDWPKQGRSRPWRGRADNAVLEGCVLAVLDHYQLARARLVGLSQGGAIALGTALNAPERVDRLVAIAPGGTLSFPPVLHQLLWLSAKLPWLTSALTGLMVRRRAWLAAFVRRSLFAGSVADFEELVDELAEEARRNGVGASDWQNASIGWRRMNVNHLPRLGEIRHPTLFIQGDRDVAVNPRFTREAAARVPGARLQMLPNHGHWPNRQSPELVNALIVDFLAERT